MSDDAAAALAAWRDTWFGDPVDWSPVLRAAAQDCLSRTEPATLAWGPDFRLLYNRAYAELLEDQHPAVRGRPAWEPAAAMWDVVGPMLQRVRVTGETQHGDRTALARHTGEGRRTHWYSWTYSAVWDGDEVAGVFAVVRDETADELAAGRVRACAAAARLAASHDVSAALSELVDVLASLPDVRFAVAHRLSSDAAWARIARSGSQLRQPTAASLLDHAESTGRWPTTPVIAPPAPVVVRAPGAGARGVWASWSAVGSVHDDVLALTVGFAPLVGDAAQHRPFMQALVDAVTGSAS